MTADAANSTNAAEYYKGIEIYYRIYENEHSYTSDKSEINKYNGDHPSDAVRYLLDTKQYRRLVTSEITGCPLIGGDSTNRNVRFRLQDFSGSTDSAMLTVAGSGLGIPYRSGNVLPDKRRFNPKNINSSDDDVQKASSSGSDAFWWINFYAASYGHDATFRSVHSSLEPLGSIKLGKKP